MESTTGNHLRQQVVSSHRISQGTILFTLSSFPKMPQCSACPKKQSILNPDNLCKDCHMVSTGNVIATEDVENDVVPGVSSQDIVNLPYLPDNWLSEPIQNLNGGHILKIFLLGTECINNKLTVLTDRVKTLENDALVKEQTIVKNGDSLQAAEERITALETQNSTLKKVLLNQQVFIEQCQRSNIAKNIMITGIPDTPLKVGASVMNSVEEKTLGILSELNNTIEEEDFEVKVFDPFTNAQGKTSHSVKVTFSSLDVKKKTLENTKNFKEHVNIFFRSVYVRNDETKLARNENYRIRKKARELRENHPDDVIKIEKGKLYHRGTEVDRFDLSNQIFC